MSGLMKNAIGFEVEMDDDLECEISNILALIELESSGISKCELREAAQSNNWIVECSWRDQQAMYSHFLSFHLQELISLLSSRSRKIVFECGSE
jgi:hypothetical protein